MEGVSFMKIDFGKTLRQYRKANNLSQQQISDALSIGRATYARYEGSTRPNYELLIKIAKIYGVTVDELLKKNVVYDDGSEVEVVAEPDVEEKVKTDSKLINLTDFEKMVLIKTRLMTYEDKMKLSEYLNNI